jgi:hypothetical protein
MVNAADISHTQLVAGLSKNDSYLYVETELARQAMHV